MSDRTSMLLLVISVASLILILPVSTTWSASAMQYSSGGNVKLDGECKAVILRYDEQGYMQIEELNRTIDQISHFDWTSEINNGSSLTVYYRGGYSQKIGLRLAARRLHSIGFKCGKDGLARVKVVDCQTKVPIKNVQIAEKGGRYRNYPTNIDGTGMVPCNCKPPVTDIALLSKEGYQTTSFKLLFSGRKIDRWQVCMNRLNVNVPTPQIGPKQPGVRWRNHRYLTVTQQMTWQEAGLYAKKMGGHLVTISDKAENDFVSNFAHNNGVKRGYWIGFTDLGHEGNWRWITNERITFTGWHRNEPNNDRNNEHCAEVGWHNKYSWNDGTCNSKLPFVIEWDN